MAETVIQINAGKFANVFLLRGDEGSILVDTGSPVSQISSWNGWPSVASLPTTSA